MAVLLVTQLPQPSFVYVHVTHVGIQLVTSMKQTVNFCNCQSATRFDFWQHHDVTN